LEEGAPAEPSSERGYSAVELVLLIVATAIVGALGFSVYRTHEARSQITLSISETEPARRLVAAAFKGIGGPPANAAAAGIDETARRILVGTYVDALEIINGRIELRFSRSAASVIAGKSLSLTPFETVDREIVWMCGNEPPGLGLRPLGFADGGAQAFQIVGSIEDRYLPPECR
jgi:hypothetical protein